jgi:hypothetical protein
MRIRVLDHAVFPDEPFPADVAGEGLLAGVKTHMTPEVSLVVELLRADVALVRLVTCVLGQVLLQRRERKITKFSNFGLLKSFIFAEDYKESFFLSV